MWQKIEKEDLNVFISDIDFFHDSCIKEMRYYSGAYVNADLSMMPVNTNRILNVVFQQQSEKNSMFELEFSGVTYMKLTPVPEEFTCEIFEAAMFFHGGYVYWGDSKDIDVSNIDNYDGTLIIAKSVKWRSIADFIGQDSFFIDRCMTSDSKQGKDTVIPGMEPTWSLNIK